MTQKTGRELIAIHELDDWYMLTDEERGGW